MEMEYVDAGGAHIPRIGLGTMQNDGRECAEVVETALELGYEHVDTAQLYGNEEAVGRGIAAADVDRGDVFLTTKVWRANLEYDDVVSSVRESLERLGVEYVDLLLAHWPHPRVPVAETLDAMTDLQDEGLVEHVGVSNYTNEQLAEAIEVADCPIVANQVLAHPYIDQSDTLAFCRANDVAVTAYSPLARGAVLHDDALAAIGDRYDKSPAQVALRWLVQRDGVVAIPKASSPEHLRANLEVFDFDLSETEMTDIAGLRPDIRTRLYNLLPRVGRNIPV